MAIPEQQVATPEQQMNSTTLPSQPQMAVPSQQEHIHIQPSNPQQLPSNYKPQEQYLQSEQLNISDRHAPQPMERPAMPLPQHGNVPPLTTENVHPNIEADISSPAVGPQFEVKPYDWEEQKTTKIEIPQVDLTSIPPPPHIETEIQVDKDLIAHHLLEHIQVTIHLQPLSQQRELSTGTLNRTKNTRQSQQY